MVYIKSIANIHGLVFTHCQKHILSDVYNTVGWDHWHMTVTTTHGLMFTALKEEIIDTWQS